MKKLYTTSEYTTALKTFDCNVYYCDGKEFSFFSNIKAADNDAQWLVGHYKKEGKKIRKPIIYRVKFERVK